MSSDEEIEFITEQNNDSSTEVLSSVEEVETSHENEKSAVTISDSESDSEENLPSGAECLRRCQEFASTTETDSALAMFFLQQNKWDLDIALNAYFEQTAKTGQKIVACFDVEKLDRDEKRKSNEAEGVSKRSKTSSESNETDSIATEELKHFKVLSWNIDGIDGKSIEARAMGVVQRIAIEKPDIVMLQEVVDQTEDILRESLSKSYEFHGGNANQSYYTMILSKKNSCQSFQTETIPFQNSVMTRNLLKVKLRYNSKVDICAMTSHLESTKEFAKPRVEQLKQSFKEMLDQEDHNLVIFGGDLNLRDSELSSIGGMPSGVHDLWQATGSRKECAFTWDMTRNTNLEWNMRFKPRLRFDRLYFRPNKTTKLDKNYTLMPVYFELEGLEKLKSCSRFCSDHWAIQSYFELKVNGDD